MIKERLVDREPDRFSGASDNFDAPDSHLSLVCRIEFGLSRSNVLFVCQPADTCESFILPIASLRGREGTEQRANETTKALEFHRSVLRPFDTHGCLRMQVRLGRRETELTSAGSTDRGSGDVAGSGSGW